MIATLRGEITHVEDNALIIEVGGVGLRVFVPAPLAARAQPGEIIFLHTYLAVRENDLSLYGFETTGDRGLFNLLLGVDGVGPKVALSFLSTLSLDTVKRALATDETDLFARVPGVGKKTAQKIAIHLQGRLKPTDTLQAVAALSDVDGEVLAALTALGYSVVEAQAAIQSLPKDAPQDVEERLRMTLGYFNR